MGVVLWQMVNPPSVTEKTLACPADALVCPDGSAVGRIGPDCTFAACPDNPSEPDISNLPVPAPSPQQPNLPLPIPDKPVACTMDAKQCPDGSYVGRVAPDCTFAACPAPVEKPLTVACSREVKEGVACLDVYQPVCGLVEVQCVTTSCNPVPQTFGNGCYACRESNVISYTEGECENNQ